MQPRSIARSVRAHALGLICALLVVALGGPRAAAETPIVDEEAGFRLDPPGGGWRLTPEREARRMVPGARAGLVGRGGVFAVVLVKPPPDEALRAHADSIISKMSMAQKQIIEIVEIEVDGRPAVRYAVRGRVADKDMLFGNTLLLHRDRLLQLVTWSTSDVTAEAFRPAWNALHLLEDEERGPVVAAIARTDLRGVGWLMRGDRYENAMLGIAAEPADGWHMAVGEELDGLSMDAELGLVRDTPRIAIHIQAQRATGRDRDALRTAVGTAPPAGMQATGRRVDAPLLGRTIELTQYAGGAGGALRGWLELNDLCLIVTGRYGEADADEAMEMVPAGLALLEPLDPVAARDAAADLDRGPDMRNRVGLTFALRNAVFYEFRHGFSWHGPSGFWRIHVDREAQVRDPEAAVVLDAPTLGVRGSIVVERIDGATDSSYHAQVVDRALRDGAAREATLETRAATGGGTAYLSRLTRRSAGLPLTHWIATLVDGDRAAQLRLTGLPGNMEAAGATLDELVQALSFPRHLEPELASRDLFLDFRLGYNVRFPGGGWEMTDQTDEPLRRAGAVRTWYDGDRSVTVVALCSLRDGQDPGWFAQFFDAVRRDRLGDQTPPSPEAQSLRLCGVPSDHKTWTQGDLEIHTYELVRDRTYFAILAIGPAGEETTSLVQRFSLIE